jgi:hypothetical protein
MEAKKMNISRTVKGRIYSKMEKLGLLDLKDGQYIKVPIKLNRDTNNLRRNDYETLLL